MRKRDPRRLLARRRELKATVRILRDQPAWTYSYEGGTTTMQAAEGVLPHEELARIWNPEYLERFARAYWAYLTKVSLGLLRIAYSENYREIRLIGRPLVLVRFFAPEYEWDAGRGTVTWRIDRGLLVAPTGRGKGFLRLTVRRLPDPAPGMARVLVTSEVASFYPTLGGWGWFVRIGRWFYALTQLQVHLVVTHAFLRHLAKLELAPSVVGRLRGRIAQGGVLSQRGELEGDGAAPATKPRERA